MYDKGHFKENYREEYHILGDWYLYNGADEGLTFLVKRKDGHEVKEMYLPYVEMNNQFLFKKEKKEDVKLVSRGVEEGEEHLVVIQYGTVHAPKMLNKERMLSAKIITYYLKRK